MQFTRKFERIPLVAEFIQYDGSEDMAKTLAGDYVGLYEEGGTLFFSSADGDHFMAEVLEDDWLHIAGERVIDIIDPISFPKMYKEVKR